MSPKKKVVVQLPPVARDIPVQQRYALELEALDTAGAEIVEVAAGSEEEFIEGARDADALITSWGINITEAIISNLEKCVVIGVGSVGVDMVDVEAATRELCEVNGPLEDLDGLRIDREPLPARSLPETARIAVGVVARQPLIELGRQREARIHGGAPRFGVGATTLNSSSVPIA